MKKCLSAMRVLPLVIFIIIMIFNSVPAFASTSSDFSLVKSYCKEHYPGQTVKVFTKWNEDKMLHRANTGIVYVELLTSKSSGKKDPYNKMYWGYIKGSNYYKTWYNKKVKKGKTVKQYLIYNPYTNYEDDIVAVIDNRKIR